MYKEVVNNYFETDLQFLVFQKITGTGHTGGDDLSHGALFII